MGWGGETRERQVGNEVVSNYSIVKNGGCEAITAIFILLSDGSLVKWRRMGYGDDSLLADLT